MGAIINTDEEERAIIHLLNLPQVAKNILSHHLRNTLQAMANGVMLEDLAHVEAEVKHMKEDLERFGL